MITNLMPLLSLVLMDIQFLLIQPKSTFPCHATVTEEISISWQGVRSPVKAFESKQFRQTGMPGRNDGMELHRLCAKCKQACRIALTSLEMFKSVAVQTSTDHPTLKAEVQQPDLCPEALQHNSN